MQDLIDKIEAYGFECEGGPLVNCVEWNQLKGAVMTLAGLFLPEKGERKTFAQTLEDLKAKKA